MKKSKTLVTVLQCTHLIILTALLSARSSFSQTSQALEKFYRLESQTWQNSISLAQEISGPSHFNVQFYHLDLTIDVFKPHISGNVICRFEVTESNISSVDLKLHRSLNVTAISGNSASFTFNNDSIYVKLDHIYQAGEVGQIQIFYEGIPQLAGGIKGLHFTNHAQDEPLVVSLSTPFLAHYWWPCKDGPGDKADSVYLDITIPDTSINGIPLIAVSNGLLENIFAINGKKKFQWRHRYPIVPYYVMVAISNYRSFSDDYANSSGKNFPLEYYVFDEHLAEAQNGVAQLPAVVALFSELFGSYPFDQEKYAMTQTGFYGAIENQTNTIINQMSADWFRVSVHELAHMWFGDMITCSDWHHGWLNEGFATYCEALWTEHLGGFSAYSEHMTYNEYYDGGTIYLQDTNDPFHIFIGIIYRKGAYFLHMLRGVLGDSLFFECLYRYSQDNHLRYDHANTQDFQDLCEHVSGQDLDYFFEQWIYGEYYPCYEYGYIQNPFDHEVTVRISQTQADRGWRPVFKMPIQLQFKSTEGTDTLLTVWNDSLSQLYRFSFSDPVVGLEFDPQRWILKESVYSVDLIQQIPHQVVLYQNFPNPFNSGTTILFVLPYKAWITLNIYDLQGKKVRSLLHDMPFEKGSHYISWNGNNNSGVSVSAGIYFYQLQTENYSQTKKMILLK